MNYPNHPPRKVRLKEGLFTIGRQLATGTAKSVAAALMKHDEFRDALYEEACDVVNKEIKDLCSLTEPSLLRGTTHEELTSLTWENIDSELKERTPRFHQFITASVSNPSHSRNIYKKGAAIVSPMCDAACQLISVFNEGMSATRRLKSVILKKGGLKKVGFQRLSPLYNCMGYKATNTMFEKFGKDFDHELKVWKATVEKDVEKESNLIEKEKETREEANEEENKQAKAELQNHRQAMHPGYSFTGDNVDIRCKPRQMTVKNQNKDHHMFQWVAFENRVSPNHLPNEAPKKDVMKEPFTTFLPNADEQAQLVNELVVLVGHKWASYIPALQWFKGYLPARIQHEHMEEMKMKTKKVILLYIVS